MRRFFDVTRLHDREPGEEELDEVASSLMQAADAAPTSPRSEAIRMALLDSLERREPRFTFVPALVVVVLVAVIGIGAALGTQSIGSLIPPPVRIFFDGLLSPDFTPPQLPPSVGEEPSEAEPDTPDVVDPSGEAEPPQQPVVVPSPAPAGPPMVTPTDPADDGPPDWVPAPEPPKPPHPSPPNRPTPPQTGPPGGARP